ncbi:MAG: hypothetical protein R3B72_38840 [Polyangiaceae bacterium]
MGSSASIARRRFSLLAALALAGTIGCRASFDIAPTVVPRLGGQQVVDVRGETVDVPARWTGTVVPVRDDDRRLMVPPDDGYARAVPVAREGIAAAKDEGWSDKPTRIRSSSDAGIGPPGTGGLPPLRRAESQSRAATGAPGEVLWVRDEGGRIVELPMAWIDHVRIVEERARGGPGRGLWIPLVAVGGAAVVVSTLALTAWTLNQSASR